MNIKHLLTGITLTVIAHILTFLQLQGQLKWIWFKQHPYLVAAIAGFPISLLFMFAVKHLAEAFNQELWPIRLLGFAIGAVVFSIMSFVLFREPVTLKVVISLILATMLLIIQIAWK